MKNLYFKLPAIFMVPIFLLSCDAPRFISAADMFGIYGTLNKTDGTKLNGYFTNMTADVGSYGVFYCDHQSKKLDDYHLVPIKEIKNLSIQSNIYEPRLLIISDDGNNKYVMLKRLSPITDTKMCLFELTYDESDKNTSLQTPLLQVKYYLQLPGSGPNMAVANINNDIVNSDFSNSMAAMVADCPVLSKKIKDKQKGYYYGHMLSGNKQITVLQRIIQEYNNCK